MLGCDIASDLVAPDEHNASGYWEAESIARLNDEMLHSAGFEWHDWQPMQAAWFESPKFHEFRDRAAELLERQAGGSHLFVVKDPRFCRLLPVWTAAVGAIGAKPVIVSPVRAPGNVATSLLKRNGMNRAVAQLVWLRHVLDAEKHTRDLPRVFVNYRSFLQDWRQAADGIASAIDLVWPRRSIQVEAEIDSFVRADKVENDKVSELSPLIAGVYQILANAEVQGIGAEEMRSLDRAVADFDLACATFGQSLIENQQHGQFLAARLASAEVQLAELGEESRARLDDLVHAERAEGLENSAALVGQIEQQARRMLGVETLQESLPSVEGDGGPMSSLLGVFEQAARDAAARLSRTEALEAELAASGESVGALVRQVEQATKDADDGRSRIEALEAEMVESAENIAAFIREVEGMGGLAPVSPEDVDGAHGTVFARLEGAREGLRSLLDMRRDEVAKLEAALSDQGAAVEMERTRLAESLDALRLEQARREALEVDLAARERKIDDMAAEKEQLEDRHLKRVDALLEERAKSEGRLSQLQSDVEEGRRKAEFAAIRFEKLLSEREDLLSARAEAVRSADDAVARLEQMSIRHAAMQEERNELMLSLSENRQRTAGLERALVVANGDLATLRHENERRKDAEARAERSDRKAEEVRDELESALAQLSELKREVATRNSTLADYDREAAEGRAQVARLEQLLILARAESADARLGAGEAELARADVSQRLAAVEVELVRRDALIDQLEARAEALLLEVDERVADLSAEKRGAARLAEQLVETRSALQVVERGHQAQSLLRSELAHALRIRNDEFEEGVQHMRRLEAQLAASAERVRQLEDRERETGRALERLRQIETSRSWRLIRRVRRWLKRNPAFRKVSNR